MDISMNVMSVLNVSVWNSVFSALSAMSSIHVRNSSSASSGFPGNISVASFGSGDLQSFIASVFTFSNPFQNSASRLSRC